MPENAELYSEKITATISKLKKLQELVKDEVTANKIASKANFGPRCSREDFASRRFPD